MVFTVIFNPLGKKNLKQLNPLLNDMKIFPGNPVIVNVKLDPVFDDLRDDLRFVRLGQNLDAILADEHRQLLQLICFNNPVPGEWQPLPETCEGVEQLQQGLNVAH